MMQKRKKKKKRRVEQQVQVAFLTRREDLPLFLDLRQNQYRSLTANQIPRMKNWVTHVECQKMKQPETRRVLTTCCRCFSADGVGCYGLRSTLTKKMWMMMKLMEDGR